MQGARGAALALVCVVAVAGCSATTGSATFSTSSGSPGSSLTEPSGDTSDALPGDASCSELTEWAELTSGAVAAIGDGPISSEQQAQLVSLADEARELALRSDDPYLSLLAAVDASLHLVAEAAPKVDDGDVTSVRRSLDELVSTCATASP
jgi:hypothetical protein